MRWLWLIPVLMVVAVAAGLSLCTAAGWNPHPRSMLAAALVALVGAGAGAGILIAVRGKTQPVIAQASLVGITLQMFASLAMCGVVYAVGIPLQMPFAMWLLTFYWVTLIAMSAACITVLRAAPIETAVH